MSNQSSYVSYSTSSFTSSTTGADGQTHTKSYSERTNYNSRDGGTVERQSHETGLPSYSETTQIPAQRGIAAGGVSQDRRIEDVTDAEKDKEQEKRDAEYLERMEDEYAKREGGA